MLVTGEVGAGKTFAANAMSAVHRVSRGIPRLINIICDNALRLGYARKNYTVSYAGVAEVVKDLAVSDPRLLPPRAAGTCSCASREQPCARDLSRTFAQEALPLPHETCDRSASRFLWPVPAGLVLPGSAR